MLQLGFRTRMIRIDFVWLDGVVLPRDYGPSSPPCGRGHVHAVIRIAGNGWLESISPRLTDSRTS